MSCVVRFLKINIHSREAFRVYRYLYHHPELANRVLAGDFTYSLPAAMAATENSPICRVCSKSARMQTIPRNSLWQIAVGKTYGGQHFGGLE